MLSDADQAPPEFNAPLSSRSIYQCQHGNLAHSCYKVAPSPAWPTTIRESLASRRRACRTSENDRPLLDGQHDIEPEAKPRLSPVLRSIRNRSSRCENVLEKLSRPVPSVHRSKHSIDQHTDPSELNEIVCVVIDDHQDKIEDTVAISEHGVSSGVIPAVVNSHSSDKHVSTLKLPRVRPKLVKSPTIDRFITPRKPLEDMKDLMHIGKKADELSPRQKLLRELDDAQLFNPAIRLRNRSVEYVRAQRTQRQIRAQSRQHSRVLLQRNDAVDNALAGNSTSWSRHGSVSSIRAASRAPIQVLDMSESVEQPRIVTSKFLYGAAASDRQAVFENRLALALDINRVNRLITVEAPPNVLKATPAGNAPRWKDNAWFHDKISSPVKRSKPARQAVPNLPFRVLEAPGLRDDFYCSALAYCSTINCLAVALGIRAYLWSESRGVMLPPRQIELPRTRMSYISSLAFSSVQGGRAILAIGRGDGQISMYSHVDTSHRFLYLSAPTSVTHLSFCPRTVVRPSRRHSSITSHNEVLLVGDDAGIVSVYLVEWPNEQDRWLYGFHGAATLHARIAVHTQQICGIAWSVDGGTFATGGNDNLCCTYSTRNLLNTERTTSNASFTLRSMADNTIVVEMSSQVTDVTLGPDHPQHTWHLNAAVKAIAFCPWQSGLIAAGGGSNDRCIHFFHTVSGIKLATIDCGAQVTSLVWSTTRREIAATFGFAQPEHPYRVAVYSWPECQEVVAIPWNPDLRALYAIPYPGGPQCQLADGSWLPHDDNGGCLVIAASDGSIKFHEIWSASKRRIGPMRGLLGGSDILEDLHGFYKDGSNLIR